MPLKYHPSSAVFSIVKPLLDKLCAIWTTRHRFSPCGKHYITVTLHPPFQQRWSFTFFFFKYFSYSYPFSVSWLYTLNTDILVALKLVMLQHSAQSYWQVDKTRNLYEIFALLGCYTVLTGNLLMLQDNLSVPSSKGPSTLIRMIIYLLYGITCYSGVQCRVTSYHYLTAFTSAQYCL